MAKKAGNMSVGSLIHGEESWRYDLTDQLGLAMVAVIWWGAFFPIFVNTLTGLTQPDGEREELFRSLGASHGQIFWKLRVPSALPLMFAGLKIGLTTALIGAVVAELQAQVPALQKHAIDLQNAPGGGIRFIINGEIYTDVSEIPDPQIQALIRHVTKEWERR